MSIEQVINRLFRKFANARIESLIRDDLLNVTGVTVVVGPHKYALMFARGDLVVFRCREDWTIEGTAEATRYSRWLAGVLLGKTRNEAGELV